MRLSDRRLNRATLARQMLLARESVDVVTAVSRLGALQAQEPASPFIALWTRLVNLDPDVMVQAFAHRRLVKATLHRSTLHVVSADDYLASVTALTTVLRTKWMSEARGLPVERTLPELADEALDFATLPRTNVEMRDFTDALGEPVPGDELWRRIRRYAFFVAVPGEKPWAFGRRPVHVAARAWLDTPRTDDAASLGHMVHSYLAAFGPARLADITQWSGLAVTHLKIGLARLDGIERFTDTSGRELLDLAGAPLPDEDSPAPARLLPMWDETLLAYRDRSRIVPEPYRKRVIVKAGDVLPTFIVDGYVAGLWWAEKDKGDARTRIVLEPFEPLAPSARNALETEGDRLATFLAEREPRVYSRYRHTARRR